MIKLNPEIAIVIAGEPEEIVVKDYEPDKMNVDMEQYTKEVMEDD